MNKDNWETLVEGFGDWLKQDATAHNEEFLPYYSNRALCWIQLEAPKLLAKMGELETDE